MSTSDDKVATDPSAGPKLARVIVVVGCAVPLKVQSVQDLKVDTDIKAEGRRLAEFLYWGAPWKFFNGLRDRLNELQPPDDGQSRAPEVDGSKALGCCDCERTFATSEDADEHERVTGHDTQGGARCKPVIPQVKGRRTETEQRAYRFLSTRWKTRTELIMACGVLPETLDSLVRKGWAVISTGACLTRYKKKAQR